MKLIIDNRTNITILKAIEYCKAVIKQGKISETKRGKQYCFATSFGDDGIVVVATKNKKSDRLIIIEDE